MLEGTQMRRFVIELTKGNDEIIIKSFQNREEARLFGEKYWASLPKGQGIVSLAEREVDENDRAVSHAERLYHIWH